MSSVVRRWIDRPWTIRTAIGLSVLRVKACWMRFSTTLLTSMTSRISGTERSTALAWRNVPVRVVADEAGLILRDIAS